MKKVFYVYAIRYLSRQTLQSCSFVSRQTYEHYNDAYTSMCSMYDFLNQEGCVIVIARVFRKVVQL